MEREQLNYLLQQVGIEQLRSLSDGVEKQAEVELIRKPTSQTLLVPIHDPINQGSFISGEILVTSALVQVNTINGWSMVMDDNPETAVSVAILDGAFAAGILREEIQQLALRGKENIEKEQAELNSRVHATRVAFDLL
ncbi:MAG: phosphonate C-P lyase system protein PhnG [Desulfopila sp.]|jgi:phosphonate C-P lyase system protein PhnG|nr:phosphonate C-P lyase system protein PhnG [Desulfopila sp.]